MRIVYIFVCSMAGWMYKASDSLMHKGAMKKRWVVLADYRLSYFEGPTALHENKGDINCADVVSIAVETSKKDGEVWRINFGKGGKEHWVLKVDETAPPHIKAMWMRKLVRSCPQVEDRELAAISPRLGRSTIHPSGRAPPLRVAAMQPRK
jgi:hypothetical protein